MLTQPGIHVQKLQTQRTNAKNIQKSDNITYTERIKQERENITSQKSSSMITQNN